MSPAKEPPLFSPPFPHLGPSTGLSRSESLLTLGCEDTASAGISLLRGGRWEERWRLHRSRRPSESRVTHTERQEIFSEKEQQPTVPDVSEIARTSMQRTSLGREDQ